MENIKYYIEEHKSLILLAIIIIALFIQTYIIYNKLDTLDFNCQINESTIDREEVKEPTEIFVDVKGKVSSPGVYILNSTARVIDAINASGGLLDDANTRFINLSKPLSNGDVIVIYSNDEIKEAKENGKVENIVYVDTPCVCEEVKNDACIVETTKQNQTLSNKVNINTASLSELMTLSGIGESKAKSILEYRESNGKFKTIDDIKNVTGISESIFSKIKEDITI